MREAPCEQRVSDRLFDALGRRSRRRVLFELLDHNPLVLADPSWSGGRDPGASILDVDGKPERIQLYHTHLPKLDEFGYVTWEVDEGTISKGPAWSEIEPLVRLLRNYRDEHSAGWL